MAIKGFSTTMKNMIRSEISEIHTALPATIINVKGMDVDVQPSVMLYQNDTHRKLPVIYSVPFMCPHTNNAGIKWNPQIGDNVLLLCCEMSIDNIMVSTGNNLVQSEDGRKFDLADAVAINGFQKASENLPLPPTDVLQITGDKQTITIKKNGDIELGGGVLVQSLATSAFVKTIAPIINGIAPGTIPLDPTTGEPISPFVTTKTKAE